MVEVLVGDIFQSKAQTLVNTVNTVGVMGKGIALEFRKRFPQMYEDYRRRCEAGEVRLGRPYLYRTLIPPWILNFPTKEHWRSVTRLDSVIEGLEYLVAHYDEWGIQSLAVPPLGSGQGRLEWRVVGPTLFRHLERLEIPVELYAPFGTPHEELQSTYLNATRSQAEPSHRILPGWVALVAVLNRIQDNPHHWPVGRTMFQKIAYFATMAGIPTDLEFRRASFGPHSPELKSLLTRLVNNGLVRETQQGRMFLLEVGPTFEDAAKTFEEDLEKWQEAIDRVADLALRLRPPQAELASTAHYSAVRLRERRNEIPTERDVLEEVTAWKQGRKPRPRSAETAAAIRHLGMLGWLDLEPSEDLPVEDEVLARELAASAERPR